MTLKVIRELQAFSSAIRRTFVQHFTRFQLTVCLHGTSATAGLFVCIGACPFHHLSSFPVLLPSCCNVLRQSPGHSPSENAFNVCLQPKRLVFGCATADEQISLVHFHQLLPGNESHCRGEGTKKA